MKRQFNIGDRVIVIKNEHGHRIPLGKHAIIDGYFGKISYTIGGWALSEDEFVRSTEYLKLKII